MMSLFVLKLLSNLALALASMAIGSAITVVVIQLRRRRQPVHPTDQSRTEDAARTQAAVEQIRQLAVDVANDVGNHSETMEGWSAQLDASRSSGKAGVLEIQSLVEGMLDANHQLHARLKLAEQKIATQAEEIRTQESNAKTDALTGLANRRLFDSELATDILSSLAAGEACSLIIFDIDHFKKFNDAHGHLAGDEVLRTVAGAVANIIRKPYLAARYGGEEFAAILPNTSAQQARAIADRMRFAIQETSVSFDGKLLSVTASIGVSEAIAGEQPRDLVRRADEAVYAAKASGRNCCYWHDGRQTLAVIEIGAEGQAFDAGQGRFALDVGHEQRQELRIEVIARGDPEHPGAAGRFEARGGMPREEALGRRQDVRCRCKQCTRGVGGHHCAACAHQNGIAGELAQAGQRRADRGLVHAQAQGARRDTVGQQQGMEDFDQVKIDLGQSRRIFHPNDHIVFIYDFICPVPRRRLSCKDPPPVRPSWHPPLLRHRP